VKTSVALLVSLLFCTGSTLGQQQAGSIKMECHDPSTSGNVLLPNETLVNGMACHVVDSKSSSQANLAPATTATTQNPASVQQSQHDGQPTPTASSQVTAPQVITAPVPANTHLVPGTTVYIEPMEGFENYLAAALRKKNVPLVPVANREQATYILKGTSEEKKPGWAKIAFTGQIHSDNEASVQVIDRASGVILFAYAVDKKNTLHGQQTTAEACAKHLKEQIEKK
jgi:hypothetical protein